MERPSRTGRENAQESSPTDRATNTGCPRMARASLGTVTTGESGLGLDTQREKAEQGKTKEGQEEEDTQGQGGIPAADAARSRSVYFLPSSEGLDRCKG